jgi:hypothetical protein
MNDGVEAFRLRLQKELGLSVGPKDPLLAQWLSQQELLEENAAEHQRLLNEFEATLGRNQTTWSEQAKGLAQQSLNAGLRAAQNSTALLLEEAARMNAAAVRKAFEEGASRMEEALAASRRIAWLSLTAAIAALMAAVCRSLGVADKEDVELLGNQIKSNKTNFLISAAEDISQRLQSRSPGTYRGWLYDTVGKLVPKHREILAALTAPFPAGASPISVAVDLLGRFVYVANNNVSAYRIGENGAFTAIPGSPFPAGANQVREFVLSDTRIQLTDMYIGPRGMLTGSARVVQEARERAAHVSLHEEAERQQLALEYKRAVLEGQSAAAAEFSAEEATITRIFSTGQTAGGVTSLRQDRDGTHPATRFRQKHRETYSPQYQGKTVVKAPPAFRKAKTPTATVLDWDLRLYVAGLTFKSVNAFRNLERLCEEHLAGLELRPSCPTHSDDPQAAPR